MSHKREGAAGIQLAVHEMRGEIELGIEHLALILEIAPVRGELRMFIELDAGMSDQDAVIALKALIDHVKTHGLPRLSDEEERQKTFGGYH
jgi:hypothetical protein